MAIAISQVIDSWHDGKREHVKGVLSFSGNYVAGGDAASFSHSAIKTTKPPVHIQMEGSAGYKFEYQRSTGKVLVRQSAAAGSPGAELGAAAYPGALTSDVVEFYGIFKVV